MQPGGQNPSGNAAPPGRQNNGAAGFRQGGITGPNAPHHHPAAAAPAPHNNMTPQDRASVLLYAGYLSAQYLVSEGVLPPNALQDREPPPPLRHQHQGPQPQPPHRNGGPIAKHRFQHNPQAPGPSTTQQHRFGPGGRPFQNQGRGRVPFPPLGQGRAPFRPPPGASAAAAAPGTAAPRAGGGFDATAAAGAPSSSRQPSLQSGGAAHGQPGEHSNSGNSVGL